MLDHQFQKQLKVICGEIDKLDRSFGFHQALRKFEGSVGRTNDQLECPLIVRSSGRGSGVARRVRAEALAPKYRTELLKQA